MSDKIISLYRAKFAGEKGSLRKDWGGKISIALAYPNNYRVGMSNLGFQVVYSLLNSRDDVVAERIFLPDDKETALYRGYGKGLLSIETQSPLSRFDIIAFSLSFENDYPNILKILDLGKIPLLAKDRDGNHPFVMAGGVTTFLNPEPIADFFDFFLLGEAESNLESFLHHFKGAIKTDTSRREILEELAKGVTSVYVPSFYSITYNDNGTIKSREPIIGTIPEKIKVARLNAKELQVNRSSILTEETEFADKVLLELGRGCGRSCRFCAAGYIYRPPRVHDEKDVLSCLNSTMDECSSIGLLSASVLDSPCIEDIASLIIKKGGDFSVSSLRADLLTSEMLTLLKDTGQKTLAIAPEAGSERLRHVINKHLTEKQILDAAGMIAAAEDFSIRLYFLMGLPTETMDDVKEILGLVKSIKHNVVRESKTRGRIGQIRLSVNCFIPKPFTPFQWFPMEETSILKKKQKWLKKAVSKEGGVRVSFDVPKWAYLQALLSMGDRRVSSMIMSAHEFDGDWARTFRHSDLNPDFFVYRPKEFDETLPWDFMDTGIRKEFLIKEYKLALKEKESDICNVGECDRCGVCKLP